MRWSGPALKRDASTRGNVFSCTQQGRSDEMVRYGVYPPLAEPLQQCGEGKRKKADIDDKVPCLLEPELTDKAFRRNWARLIQKIHPVEFPIGNPIQLGK